MKLSKHHQMMVNDGFPAALIMTPEERREAWDKAPPRPMPQFADVKRGPTETNLASVERYKEEEKRKADVKFNNRIARAKERSSYVPGAVWDTSTCRWIHPNMTSTTNSERNIMPNTNGEKTVPEMTVEYNSICNSPAGKSLGLKQIVKFRDVASAKARLKEVWSKIHAMAATGDTKEETKEPKETKEKEPRRRLPFTHSHSDVVEDFDFKCGSNREKLLHLLLDNFENMVSKTSLGKLAADVPGITWRIDAKKMAYELREKKEDGVKSYGLYRKVHD